MNELKNGSAGIADHVPGVAATVSQAATSTGGINAGNFIETDIDEELFRFNSEDTPLMNLMLRAKKVKVNSPEVDHYMIDEPISQVYTTKTILDENHSQGVLTLDPKDQTLIRTHSTLLFPEIDGYDAQGNVTPGKPLMVYVIGMDANSNNPIIRAVNGKRLTLTDEITYLPLIPKGSLVVMLANALYETQKEVDPDLIIPQPQRIYLQKRGMNQVVSDYFDAQRKRTPFTKAIIAEQAIANFKVRGNRTLWAGRAGKITHQIDKLGAQITYFTEGVRWQFKKELLHSGRWTIEKVIAMAKMFFTGEDVPKTALLLAGKNLLEQIQCIDFSKHPEIQITTKTNALGWSVTNFHTVFGDIEIKREPTLDRLGWSNSGALIGEDRLVHYIYSAEHSFSDRVEGQEATRSGILIWDALALKGSCHIWIDGEGNNESTGARNFILWDSAEAPNVNDGDETRYYLLVDCPGMGEGAKAGQIWYYAYNGTAYEWKKYNGEISA